MKTNTIGNIALAAAFAGLLGGTSARLHAQPTSGQTAATASSTALLGVMIAQDNPDVPKHACKGQNDCKGKGSCKTSANACMGQNQCKGQGGCKPAKCP